MILPTWFDHLEESYSHKNVQFKKICSPVKTSCPSAENINKTPATALIFYATNSPIMT